MKSHFQLIPILIRVLLGPISRLTFNNPVSSKPQIAATWGPCDLKLLNENSIIPLVWAVMLSTVLVPLNFLVFIVLVDLFVEFNFSRVYKGLLLRILFMV